MCAQEKYIKILKVENRRKYLEGICYGGEQKWKGKSIHLQPPNRIIQADDSFTLLIGLLPHCLARVHPSQWHHGYSLQRLLFKVTTSPVNCWRKRALASLSWEKDIRLLILGHHPLPSITSSYFLGILSPRTFKKDCHFHTSILWRHISDHCTHRLRLRGIFRCALY